MNWQIASQTLSFLSALLMGLVILYVYGKRDKPGAGLAVLLMIAVGVWSLMYGLEYGAETMAGKLVFAKLEYFGVATVSPLLFLFALRYTGRDSGTIRRAFAVTMIIPIVSILLVWANPGHHLMWSSVALDTAGGLPLLVYDRGPAFWVMVIYSYGLLFISSVLFIKSLLRAHRFYRWQISLVLMGLAAPWCTNILYLTEATLFRYLDFTPIAFSFTALALAIGLFRYRMLKHLPISRQAVMEGTLDGILILDLQWFIVDHNSIAPMMLGLNKENLIGLPIQKVLPENSDFLTRLPKYRDFSDEILLEIEGNPFWRMLTVSDLENRSGKKSAKLLIIRDITERRAAETALRKSEKKFRNIVENIDQMFFNIDADGIIRYTSPASEKIMGRTPEELAGRHFSDFLFPDDYDLLNKSFRDVLSGITYPDEYRILHKSGEIRWIRSSSRPIVENGKTVGILGVLSDITESRNAEEALRESEDKYRHLFTNAPNGIFEVDFSTGRFLNVNDVICEYTGYTREELKNMGPLSILTKNSQEVFLHWLVKLQAGQKMDSEPEYQILDKAGNRRWVVLNTRYNFSDDQITGATVVVHDITGRKAAEESLREWEGKYRTLIENVNDGILVLQDGIVVFANHQALSHLGHSTETIFKKEIRSILLDQDLDAATKWYKTILDDDSKGNQIEIRVRANRGDIRWLRLHGVVIDWEGKPAVLGFFSEITDQKTAEEEKANLQDQLQQSQKMEAIGILASGVAHDFNNLLQGLAGYIEVLNRDAYRNGDSSRTLTEMDQTVHRGAELVRRLLTFSRKVEVKLKPVDLNREVQRAVSLLMRTIPKMIRIDLDVAEGLHPINGDAGQLEQIILNLGTNAKDAMPEGGLLSVKTANVAIGWEDLKDQIDAGTPGEFVRLSVADTGAGMDEETKSHIFEPFFTTKDVGSGTGLGMAAVYGIVKNHGGWIDCRSTLGKGTVFDIYFPALPGDSEIETPLSETETDIRGGTETILVVDDEPGIRETVMEILSDNGYRILTASNGEEALEVFRDHINQIDLVILDLGMPVMGGAVCFEQLREIRTDVRVIISSGYAADAEAFARTSKANSFLRKPFRMMQLLQTVRHVLDADAAPVSESNPLKN